MPLRRNEHNGLKSKYFNNTHLKHCFYQEEILKNQVQKKNLKKPLINHFWNLHISGNDAVLENDLNRFGCVCTFCLAEWCSGKKRL